MNTPLVADPKQADPLTGKVRIFISYASEDNDIAKALYKTLDDLGTLCSSYVLPILDTKSFEVGSPEPLWDSIAEELVKDDYFIILYARTMKKSHAYPGAELGFFRGLMRSEIEISGSTRRKIVPIYFDEKPPMDSGELGINLNIDKNELQMSPEDYRTSLKKQIAQQGKLSLLIAMLQNIAGEADARYRVQIKDNDTYSANYQNRIAQRTAAITDRLVPDLMLALHACLSRRVRKSSIEQKLLELHFGKAHAEIELMQSVPDDTLLTSGGSAFSLFGLPSETETVLWSDFKQNLQQSGNAGAAATIAAIERSVMSAVSVQTDRDDEQIFKPLAEQTIYRIIVTKQYEYYDGTRLVQIYLIPTLRLAILDGSKVAVTLGFINVAVKYRELFINPESDFYRNAFMRLSKLDELQQLIRRIIRELLLIEDQSKLLNLDSNRSIGIYYGNSPSAGARAGELTRLWNTARANLLKTAQELISVQRASDAELSVLRDKWIAVLDDFVAASNEINSEALKSAIGNLERYVFEG